MADVILIATPRTERGSGPAGRLRRAGLVPAVVYGLDAEPQSVSVVARELGHVLAGASGANTLITLKVGGDEQLTLARQIQRHPTRGELTHVDFVRIRRDVAVSAEVPVHVQGEAPGVKAGGLLEQTLFTVTVEAKPADIPVALTIDVSELELGHQLHVSDLVVPAGVDVQQEPGALVVQVAVPRAMAGEGEGEAAEGEAAEGEAAEGEAAASPDAAGPEASDSE